MSLSCEVGRRQICELRADGYPLGSGAGLGPLGTLICKSLNPKLFTFTPSISRGSDEISCVSVASDWC